MNSVSAITDKILAEAKTYAEEQLAAADSDAAAAKAEYQAQAAEQTGAILAEAERAAALAEERAQSQAEMDRRQMLLASRQQCIGKAFGTALDKLCAQSDEDKALLLVRLVMKYQTGDAQLIFSRADQATVAPLVVETVDAIRTKQQLKETFSGGFVEQIKKLMAGGAEKYKTTLSPQKGAFRGGLIIKQGDVEQNCTYEVLISGVRDGLEGDVSALLFG